MVKIVRRHRIQDDLQDNSSVLTLFARAGDLFKSTDSKDLIYALIGFLNPGVEIKPDHDLGHEDVFSSAARSFIEGIGNLDILAYSRGVSYSRNDIPSWCPDWSGSFLEVPMTMHTNSCQAALPGRPGHLFIEGTNPSQRPRAPKYRET
jgi:hypothetical protein